MSPPRGGQPIRCPFCARTPLLATFGLDQDRNPFVHIMVYKQKRIFGNVVACGGPVHLQCRECNRWLKINFVKQREVNVSQVASRDVPRSVDGGAVRMMDATRTV